MAAQGEKERDEKERSNLLEVLPREKGWFLEHLYQYEGCWYNPGEFGLEGVLRVQQHFKAKPSDVLLASLPKSGTTWLKALVFAIMNNNKDDNNNGRNLLTSNPHECVPFLELPQDDYYDYIFNANTTNNEHDPRLLATHIPFTSLPPSVSSSSSGCCKIIYICRDPKDVLVSFWHYVFKIMTQIRQQNPEAGKPPLSLEEAYELFSRGVSPFGPYWVHVLGYWKASLEMPHRVLFLKYEDIHKEPLAHVKKIAQFLDRPLSEEAAQRIVDLCSFEGLSNLEVNKSGVFKESGVVKSNHSYFRQGQVGDWRNHLTQQMAANLDQITRHHFAGSGLALWDMEGFTIDENDQIRDDEEEAEIVKKEEIEQLKECLPKTTFMGSSLVKYQGFWWYQDLLMNVLAIQRHFEARDSDIIIASFPKTGNTWLKALLFAIINRRIHNNNQGSSSSSSCSNPLLIKHPHELVYCLDTDVYGKAFDYPQPRHLKQLPSPRLLHTHFPYFSLPESVRTSGCRILYLTRNPLDTYISYYHFAISFMKKFEGEHFQLPKMEDFFEDCYQERTGWGPFSDHVLQYWKQSLEQPDKVLFLMYEDLKDDPVAQLKRLARFIGLPFTPQEESEGVIQQIVELCSFKNLKDLEVNKTGVINNFFDKKSYFRKGEVGDWANYFTPAMVDKMKKSMEEKLDGSGLSFRFSHD